MPSKPAAAKKTPAKKPAVAKKPTTAAGTSTSATSASKKVGRPALVVVHFVYSDQCPHCIDFKPTWETFARSCRRRWPADRVSLEAWPWEKVVSSAELRRKFDDVRVVPHVSMEVGTGKKRVHRILDPALPRTTETLLKFVEGGM